MVNHDNYEEYLMMDADGELNPSERAALTAFLASNPSLTGEYDGWQGLKLRPDPEISFPGKDALLKPEPKVVVRPFRPAVWAAAAAVLAAVILIPVLWKEGPKRDDRSVVTIPAVQPAVPVKIPMPDTSAFLAAVKAPEAASRSVTGRSTSAMPKSAHMPSVHIADSRIGAPDSVEAIPSGPSDSIALRTPGNIPVGINAGEMPVPPVAEAPAENGQGLPRIEFAAANRPAFNLLKQAFETRVAQVSAAARSVRETALVIKLGKGSVNINL